MCILPIRYQIKYTQTAELESITDPAKRKTTFVYNPYGQHTDTLYPDGTKQSYSYNCPVPPSQ